ncbi:MAG: family 78 glycoside hydrolase catalytic domain [Saprospiraceae bacterium]|nr:family 78 glycoside hydrolase catalytic domain [Saprospiraceae bacterium]
MISRLLFSLLLLLGFLSAGFTQGNTKVKGSWFTPEILQEQSFDWQAQWIWLDEQTHSDVLLARHSFELEDTDLTKAQIRITASTHYQLYINGQYIAQGPARSAPHHQSFDLWEVKRLLQTGKNTIAARVHHQQGKYSYHFDGRAGLLLQLDLSTGDKKHKTIISDQHWKVAPDHAWDNEAPKINRFQLVVGDLVDLRKQMTGWNTSDFDDSAWSQATPLMRKVGWPSVQKNARASALTPPWTNLIPRDLPYLIEVEKQPKELIASSSLSTPAADSQSPIDLDGKMKAELLQAWNNLKENNQPCRIPGSVAGQKQFLLFDFGSLLMGTPQLKIQGEAGAAIEVRCAPFMVNNQFNHKVVFSEFKDRLILSGEMDQWEATYWKPTRYLALLIDSPTPVIIHQVGVRALSYPFEQKGSMQSADAPWIQAYMQATAKTIEACTTDGYTDNYRERRQYAQTGYYGAMGNYWIFGDPHLQRRYLVQVAQEQEANGMMPAYAPLAADDYMIIMDSNCLWIRSLRDYFLHTGDVITVQQLLPAAQKLMALLHSYTNELGLIDNPPYPYWLDHAVIDRRGANLNLNGHYLGALEDFAEVLNWLGEAGGRVFTKRAELARQSIRHHFWDAEKQLFADALIDGKRSAQAGEHANAMALGLKIATTAQAKAVAEQLLVADELNYVKRANGMIMVTPAMSYFLHKGLCNYGYIDESLALFRRRFDKMLDPSTNQTLFEEWWLDRTGRSGQVRPHSRSDAQTESCFPPALFGEFLLGVRPMAPGMTKVEVHYPNTQLHSLQGKVPSPHGTLTVHWESTSTQERQLSLEVPSGMELLVNLGSFPLERLKRMRINGRPLSRKERKKDALTLAAGDYRLQF